MPTALPLILRAGLIHVCGDRVESSANVDRAVADQRRGTSADPGGDRISLARSRLARMRRSTSL
jgi:hypothetical protein